MGEERADVLPKKLDETESTCFINTAKQLEYTDFYGMGKFPTKVMTTVLWPNLFYLKRCLSASIFVLSFIYK